MKDYERNQKLKELCTPEFLAKLVEAAKLVGWGVDLIEVDSFIRECYAQAGLDMEDFEPYEIDYTTPQV